jgi:uncharacterized membrane protein YhhN
MQVAVLALIALLVAAVDWVAVAMGNKRLEFVAKPATMLPIIAIAATIETSHHAARLWFVVGLVLSLFGDIFLMQRDDEKWFVPGLGSFLLGHIAFIVGLTQRVQHRNWLPIGAIVVLAGLVTVGPKVVRGAVATDRRLGVPVALYMVVISVMVVFAFGSTLSLAIVGSLLFYLSDATIGWSRFVKNFAAAPLLIIVTYHLAQLLLALSIGQG